MPIRNPFRKNADILPDGRSTQLNGSGILSERSQSGNVVPTNPIEIKDAAEYKLSEINDSGVFLPPSPPERPSFRHTRSSGSFASSNYRSVLSENEPFNMSRESFDSYRRSFDISARSPIPDLSPGPLPHPRGSLDSRLPRRSRASPHKKGHGIPPSRTPEEDVPEENDVFEDVGLNDEHKPTQKRRGLFARFGENVTGNAGGGASSGPASDGRPNSGHGMGLWGARKRGGSGQGAELKSLNRGAGASTKGGIPPAVHVAPTGEREA